MLKHKLLFTFFYLLSSCVYFFTILNYWKLCDLGGPFDGITIILITLTGMLLAVLMLWIIHRFLPQNFKQIGVLIAIPVLFMIFFIIEINSHKDYPDPFCVDNNPFKMQQRIQ